MLLTLYNCVNVGLLGGMATSDYRALRQQFQEQMSVGTTLIAISGVENSAGELCLLWMRHDLTILNRPKPLQFAHRRMFPTDCSSDPRSIDGERSLCCSRSHVHHPHGLVIPSAQYRKYEHGFLTYRETVEENRRRG